MRNLKATAVIVYVRVYDGEIKKGTKIRMFNAASVYEVTGVGVFTPNEKVVDSFASGDGGLYYC